MLEANPTKRISFQELFDHPINALLNSFILEDLKKASADNAFLFCEFYVTNNTEVKNEKDIQQCEISMTKKLQPLALREDSENNQLNMIFKENSSVLLSYRNFYVQIIKQSQTLLTLQTAEIQKLAYFCNFVVKRMLEEFAQKQLLSEDNWMGLKECKAYLATKAFRKVKNFILDEKTMFDDYLMKLSELMESNENLTEEEKEEFKKFEKASMEEQCEEIQRQLVKLLSLVQLDKEH